jgi:hypothetical protein
MPVRAIPIERNPVLFITADVVEKNKAKTMAANILSTPKAPSTGPLFIPPLTTNRFILSF